jgi:hypothetical protein
MEIEATLAFGLLLFDRNTVTFGPRIPTYARVATGVTVRCVTANVVPIRNSAAIRTDNFVNFG